MRVALATVSGCVIGMSSLAMADEVRLMNGGKLTGNVLSIHEGGGIRFESPLAADALLLRGNAVKQVDFKRADSLTSSGNARVELSNQDFLIGTLLSYSRETGVRVQADGIGELDIPVGSMKNIHLNIQSSQVIYDGPDKLANWTMSDRRGSQNWQFNRDRLSVNGTGQIDRMLELPDRYMIRLKLNWQGQPNFQLSFSDPLKEPGVRVDRYYLQFGRAGLEIKRETTNGRRYPTLGTLNRTPDQFPNREMEIELRVDRAESVIHLAIDGKQEGRFMDYSGNPPAAGGISLVSNASARNQLDITKLTVESWHEKTPGIPIQQHNAASDRDSLMMREGDHFGGVLQSIRPVEDGLLFTMKVDFREQPMEILGEDVAVVSFATQRSNPKTTADPEFVMKLSDRGRLSVTQSTFEQGRIHASHPLLGDLNISHDSVSSLERRLIDEKPVAK